MSTKYGSCLAARALLATACGFTPQSPPETKWNASVAFAGIVRNLYSGEAPPILNRYSVPGARPVNSARYTFRSVIGNGRDCVLTTVQRSAAAENQPAGRSANDTSLLGVSQSDPIHWTVMVVVGSRCQVRNS